MNFIQDIYQLEFLRNALIGGILASIACGAIGPFVVVRKIGHLAGGISHAVLGGMGAAIFLGGNALLGAIAAAVIAATIIGIVSERSKQNEDTTINAIWSVGMALGILFLSQTPGYNADLMSYLFGNILLITHESLLLLAILSMVVCSLVALFFQQLVSISFDEEFSRVRGLKARFFYFLLLYLTSLTVVILIQMVGLILVLALLTLPAAVSRSYFMSLKSIVLSSLVLGICFSTVGLYLAYSYDLPTGAVIVLVAGSSFLISGVAKKAA